jgi:hypothetical protein
MLDSMRLWIDARPQGRAGATRQLPVAAAWVALASSLVSGRASAEPPPHPTTASQDPAVGGHISSDTATAHRGYNLFEPTPREEMREFAPDRPDTTESPITVDAGHFQFELEAVSVERDQGATELTTGVLEAKAGLTEWADLQVIIDGLHDVGGQNARGDISLRTKLNFWGNDQGLSAFGMIPFITLAGSESEESQVDGGLIFPLELRLPQDWEFGTMLEFDAVSRPEGRGIDAVVSATTGHPLWRELDGFIELESRLALERAEPAEVAANAGLVLGASDDIEVDTGVRVGLTDAADDFVAFVGGTTRF